MELPVIDYRHSQADVHFATSISQYGFAVLVGHPLSQHIIDGMYREWGHWFRDTSEQGVLSRAECARNPDTQEGYFSLADAEFAANSEVRDLKEYFHIFCRTIPKLPEPLHDVSWQQFRDCTYFSKQLMRVLQKRCPDDRWYKQADGSDAWEDSDQHLLRVLHYPALEDFDRSVEARAHAHTDVNLLTLLPVGTTPGLQLKYEGEWLDVPFGDGCLIVNAGDALSELSGGFYPSAMHRVYSNPKAQTAARMSLPFFFHANLHKRLSDEWTAGAFLQERLKRLGVLVDQPRR